MGRTIKKEKNLNNSRTGCSPCMREAKAMQKTFSRLKNSEKKTEEVQKIISSMFNKKIKV
tara:strand:+ start:82 stop:261 length:180 start_codon:yes stop_codon:yes gene_type:complete